MLNKIFGWLPVLFLSLMLIPVTAHLLTRLDESKVGERTPTAITKFSNVADEQDGCGSHRITLELASGELVVIFVPSEYGQYPTIHLWDNELDVLGVGQAIPTENAE